MITGVIMAQKNLFAQITIHRFFLLQVLGWVADMEKLLKVMDKQLTNTNQESNLMLDAGRNKIKTQFCN